MAAPSEKILDHALQLANKLTGERARYNSQSSILPKIKTMAEAIAIVDELKEAIEQHEKWRRETGFVPGSRIRRHYVKRDGTHVIIDAEISGYKWDTAALAVEGLWLVVTPEVSEVFGGTASRIRLVLERLGDEAGQDPVADLEAERAKLVARIAEIDAELADLKGEK